MVYRFQITYDEIIDTVDLKYIPTLTIGYTLPPGMYEILDINLMLKSLLSKEVKINTTIDDVRLKAKLTTNKTIKFTKKIFFFHSILGLTQSHSAELGDILGLAQLIPDTYKGDRPDNFTGIDKVHLKCDCNNGSIVNGVREPIFYSFGLSSPPGCQIYKEPRIKLLEKVNKSILSHIRLYLEDDDYKSVDFNGETISFTFQSIKI